MNKKQFRRSLLLVCTIVVMTLHHVITHAAQPLPDREMLEQDLRSKLEIYDVNAVRTILQTGLCTNVEDTNSSLHPFNVITRRLFALSQTPPLINVDGWQERFFNTLDLFFTETDLNVNMVRSFYHCKFLNKPALWSSTLLQECFHNLWCDQVSSPTTPTGISRIDIAQHLVKRGARLHCKNNEGKSPFDSLITHYAENNGVMILIPGIHTMTPISKHSSFIAAMKTLQRGYPPPAPDDHSPSEFAKDAAKIDFTTGILSVIDVERLDKSRLLATLNENDIKYLRLLKKLGEKARQYHTGVATELVLLNKRTMPSSLVMLIATYLDSEDIAPAYAQLSSAPQSPPAKSSS